MRAILMCFGQRGDLLKILWHDGFGMSLYTKAAGAGAIPVAVAYRRVRGDLGSSAQLNAGRRRLAHSAAHVAATKRG